MFLFLCMSYLFFLKAGPFNYIVAALNAIFFPGAFVCFFFQRLASATGILIPALTPL